MVCFAVVSVSILFVRVLAPDRYDTFAGELGHLLRDVPDEIVLGSTLLLVVAAWIVTMIVVAKALYYCWKQIDEYVFWVWNLVLPESPLIRFAAGVTIMLFVFVFGPLLVIQGTDFLGEDEDVEDRLDANQTEPDNETERNESITSTNSTESRHSYLLSYTYPVYDITLQSKDPYLRV